MAFRLPVRLVVIDLVGALVAGVGFWALIDERAPALVPAFATPGLAPALLIVGIGLMGYAVGGIFAAIRRSLMPRGSPSRK